MVQASAFFPSLKYSLRIFVTATKSFGGGNGNLLFLTGLLQPWLTLTLLSQGLTKVMKTFASYVMNSIYEISERTFLYKEAFPVFWISCEVCFSKICEICSWKE